MVRWTLKTPSTIPLSKEHVLAMLRSYAEGEQYALGLPFPTSVEEMTSQMVAPYEAMSCEELSYLAAYSSIMLGRMSAHVFREDHPPIEPSRN